MKMNALDWFAFALLIIGGLNWGFVGLFKIDIITSLFGSLTTLTRVIYDLIGLAAIYMIFAIALQD